jgi:LPXTG-site transpeptidase (sortase) family protein
VSDQSGKVARTKRFSPTLLIIAFGAIILVEGLSPGLLTQQLGSHSDLPDQSNLEPAIPLLPETPLENRDMPLTATDLAAHAPDSNFADNQPVRLVISTLGIDVPIQPVGLAPVTEDGERYFQWQVPDGRRVGWHKGGARLGEPGNMVLNGHNNIQGQVFKDLADLEVGAEIVVHGSDSSYTYKVTQKEIVAELGQPLSKRLENARWIEPTEEEQVTLVSCWPYVSNTHRVIIMAKPVNDVDY